MKRLFLASAALALSSFAASAAGLVCIIDVEKGDRMIYHFSALDSSTLEELGVEKNSTMMTHSPDRRPRWNVEKTEATTILEYIPDPRFTIELVGTTETDRNGHRTRIALMGKNAIPMGRGVCAWEGVKPRKYSPRPEKF